jgi:hypothetical protein
MKRRAALVIAVSLLLAFPGAYAQEELPVDSQATAVWNNASGGAVVGRRPGLRVRQGVTRYRNAQNDAISRIRNGPTITDTAADRPPEFATQVKAAAIQYIFENLTALIVAYNLQLRTQAGLPPVTPSPDGQPALDNLTDLLGNITGPSTTGGGT